MNIYDFEVIDNHGKPVSLKKYEGNVLLVVNTATKCGLTPQYSALQALYDEFHGKGFEILDFPCNQFLEQAPGTDEQIEGFCTLNYGTTFPRFSKIEVNGDHTAPLYVWLKGQAQEAKRDDAAIAFEKKVAPLTQWNRPQDIKWNFGKFLVDRTGKVVAQYSPAYSLDTIKQDIGVIVG